MQFLTSARELRSNAQDKPGESKSKICVQLHEITDGPLPQIFQMPSAGWVPKRALFKMLHDMVESIGSSPNSNVPAMVLRHVDPIDKDRYARAVHWDVQPVSIKDSNIKSFLDRVRDAEHLTRVKYTNMRIMKIH